MPKRRAGRRTKITKLLASPLCQDRLATFATLLAAVVLILAGTLLATTSWLVLWIAIFAVEALLLASTLLFIRLKAPTRLRQVRLAILAVVVLLSADLLTLQITRELLDSDSRRSTGAVALLAIAVVSMLAAAIPLLRTIWQRLPEIDQNLRRNSLSFSRILSFGVFMALAGLTSYFAWKHLIQRDPDSKVVIGLLTATFVALLFALWGRDLVRRLQKVGPQGIELGVWQESGPALDPLKLLLNRWSGAEGNGEEKAPSVEESWKYEQAMSYYLYLAHRGTDIHELGGADLRSYRQLILLLGKMSFERKQYQTALDILEPLDYLRDVTYDELLNLALAHWYLAVKSADSQGTTHGSAQNIVFHYKETKRLLERAITSPNHEALAHWVLAYVYDELGVYDQAVVQNQIAIDLDRVRFRTWGWWNAAVSYLKNGEPDLAINALARIKSDDNHWQEIWEDEELAALRADATHGSEFEKFYRMGLWEREWLLCDRT